MKVLIKLFIFKENFDESGKDPKRFASLLVLVSRMWYSIRFVTNVQNLYIPPVSHFFLFVSVLSWFIPVAITIGIVAVALYKMMSS